MPICLNYNILLVLTVFYHCNEATLQPTTWTAQPPKKCDVTHPLYIMKCQYLEDLLSLTENNNSSFLFQIIDIILARDPDATEKSGTGVGPTPVERRRRRKLPLIERPRSAPVHASPETILRSGPGHNGSTNCLNCSNSNLSGSVCGGSSSRNRHRSYRDGSVCGGSVHDLQIRDADDDQPEPVQQQLRTVIKIGEHGQRIEHHHHHFHHQVKSVSSVDTPYSMTPAQSVENFHNSFDDRDDDDDEQVKKSFLIG